MFGSLAILRMGKCALFSFLLYLLHAVNSLGDNI